MHIVRWLFSVPFLILEYVFRAGKLFFRFVLQHTVPAVILFVFFVVACMLVTGFQESGMSGFFNYFLLSLPMAPFIFLLGIIVSIVVLLPSAIFAAICEYLENVFHVIQCTIYGKAGK